MELPRKPQCCGSHHQAGPTLDTAVSCPRLSFLFLLFIFFLLCAIISVITHPHWSPVGNHQLDVAFGGEQHQEEDGGGQESGFLIGLLSGLDCS